MSDEKKPINEGYIPKTFDYGYQPQKPQVVPTGDPKPQGGYVPKSTGDNPTNNPPPPGDE